ncbi:MAG: 6,7-dimethyl-8-ribityllumazine synthase [Gammaproteobacteria bacterium]|nr:6,7-dimethyl-8-ribityllumazine synthase [Gammaproteobacteria bacterium]
MRVFDAGNFRRSNDGRIAVIAGRWHNYIVDSLMQGALATAAEHGFSDTDIDVVQAPGAYEMPLIAQQLIASGGYVAVVTLGVVIRGETPHFDYVAGECARGLANVALATGVPVGFGVLTVNNVDQALARAQAGESNKGREAMLAALEVAGLIEQFAR